MFSSVAMPASMTTVGLGAVPPHTALSRASASSSVPGSLALPGRISQLRGKPAPSSASASVMSGQSSRFCLERPKRGSSPWVWPW